MSPIKNKLLLNLILIFSIFALIAAYFIQYILGHAPCNLCLIERVPYIAAITLISLIFFFNKSEKLIVIILGVLFGCGAIISFYHFGIEQGFFMESIVCGLNNDDLAFSSKDLLKQLEKETISCKNVTFRVLGLSLATFNTIISLIISVIMLNIGFKYDKNK